MREFILLSLKGKTTPFNASKLVEENRMDLICRFVSNSLWVSKGYRQDTIARVVLNGPPDPPKTVTFIGSELVGLDPDERSVAFALNKALKRGMGARLNEEIDVSPGVKVSKKSLEQLLKEAAGRKIYYMDEDGKSMEKVEEGVFIVGDFIGLPKKTMDLIEKKGGEAVSIGPVELFSSHIPVIIHNFLDRKAFKAK